MVLRLCFALFLFAGCMDFDRDNPYDRDGNNYGGYSLSSSSRQSSSSSRQQSNNSNNSTSSSSSSVLCRTAANNTSTQYCSYGVMKEYGFVTHGGQTYKTIEIGTQVWMAENLNYDVPGSVCYDDNHVNCEKYGKLYDWAAAMNIAASYNTTTYTASEKHKGICPEGWHIPSYSEWGVLMNVIGGWNTGGEKHLKAIEWGGEDTYGFAALPGGGHDGYGYLKNIGDYGSWWSTYAGTNLAYFIYDGNDWTVYLKSHLHSVRCIQN